MNIHPKISVIIPVYNGEEYLPVCLDSVIHQTMTDIEIFCVDDGSTDHTPEILKQYAQKDSRIRVITQKNGGAGAARNNALQYVTGEYLSILDADDFFELEMLEKAYAKVKETESDIVVFRSDNYISPENRYEPLNYSVKKALLPETQPFAGTDIQKDVFRVFVGWAWDKLFRTEFVRKHRFYFQEQRTTNDLLFVFNAVVSAEKIVTMDDVLAHHRRGIKSLSVTREKSWHCFYDALIAMRDSLIEMGLYSRFEDDFINYSAGFSLWHLETLAMPQQAMLYERLHSQWLADLGVADYPMEKFYDVMDYCKCRRILHRQTIGGGENQPKVSVVLPSLNVAPYIRECIESAINQTMREIEIICVDAGSTDGTLEILEEYAQKDSRIRIIHSPIKSYGHQMNLGLDAARGEYFAILETDDYIKPLMFEELYQLAEDNYLDIIKPDYSIFVTDGNGWKYFTYQAIINTRILSYNTVYNPADNLETFKAKNNIWTGLYDLEFLKANQIRFHESPGASYQDNGFWFLTMCHAHRIMFYEKDYYMLRRDNPNSSVHSRSKVFCMCHEYDFIRNELRKDADIEARFAPVLALFRFKNYQWNYHRIGDEYKDEFLERFSSDFKALQANGEIHGEYFDMEESFRLKMILEAPIAYKYHRLAVENRENTKTIKTGNPESMSSKLERTKYDLDCVHKSVSFRIGRAVTWLPRKIRGGVRCLAAHGWKYTFIRLLFHMGLVKNNEPERLSVPASEIQRDYNFYSGIHRDYYRTELMKWYEATVGSRLNLNYPKTFNEKIQWMKLYDSTPLKTMLSDKYQVRDYVAKKIGEEYLVPLLGVWDRFDDIDIAQLPDRFVLKTNHGRGTNLIVTNKETVDLDEMRRTMNNWLSVNYAFKDGFELQYMNIKPRIIAEEYLGNAGGDLKDYKVFCFNGKADCIMHLSDRRNGLRMAFFDLDWNKMDYTYSYPRIEEDVPRPQRLKELIDLAEKLSKGFAHVRVDFYELNDGRILFDEMAFTSASGVCKWSDQAINERFGKMITLPIKSPIPQFEGMEVYKRQAMGNAK
ncbi:MAG: glycosyltransferase [Firmicutes bacterium]|nr:glycosyltransferase [Bacillota bacterium]